MPSLLDRLQTIEDYAIDGSPAKVGSALRACLALGERLQSAELTEWATAELHGYRGESSVPDYREFQFPLTVDANNGAWSNSGVLIPMSALPDDVSQLLKDVPLTYTVDELASFIESNEQSVKFVPKAMTELMQMIPHLPGFDDSFVVTRVCYDVPVSILRGIVAAVAAKLVLLVAEIRDRAESEQGEIARESVDNATRVVIHGDNAVVTTASSGGSVSVMEPATETLDKTKTLREWLVVIARYAAVAVAGATAYIAYLEYVRAG